jgi:hypothetical protein
MATALLDLLKDANLIKFFAIVGSIFFLFGVTGRVWGVKEPITGFSKFVLFFLGALMLAGAAMGFIDNKNQYFSKPKNNENQQIIETQSGKNNNNQKVSGSKNNTNGNTTGNNNQNVQGNNNNVNSNNQNISNSSYVEGDYTIHYTYNTITGDTLSKKATRNKKKTSPQLEEEVDFDDSACNLNNKTYWSITMSSQYFLKFYDKSGNKYKFIAYESAENIHGTATQNGDNISLNGNFGRGEVSLSNGCKYLTGHIQGNYGSHALNYQIK